MTRRSPGLEATPTSLDHAVSLARPSYLHRAVEIETERLLLRAWRPDDFEDFARISADPEVMRYIANGEPATRAQGGVQDGGADAPILVTGLIDGAQAARSKTRWAAAQRSSPPQPGARSPAGAPRQPRS